MDPKQPLPEINLEPNKPEHQKRTAQEMVAALLGPRAVTVAGGLTTLGSSAGAAGALGGTGLLATKAGMFALVFLGSAVAGGLGLAGYTMASPDNPGKSGGSFSLFAPKAPSTSDPDAVAPVNADGSSESLKFMADAAAKDKAAEDAATAASAAAAGGSGADGAASGGAADDPAKAAAAADAAARAAASRSGSGSPINGGSGSGAAGTMGLSNVRKLGALSGVTGGGATTSANSGASARLGDNMANAAKNGASSAFSKGGAASKASSARGIASRNGKSARSQARNVMGDQANGRAGSSFAGGRTYDGSTAGGGGSIGPDGSAIGMGGVGDGVGAQPKTLPANAKGKPSEVEPPVEAPPAKDVTPWAKQIMIGMALGAVAIAALFWASSMIKEAKATCAKGVAMMQTVGGWKPGLALVAEAEAQLKIARLVIGAAMAAALGGMVMGGMIAGGKNGQTLQGGLLLASSAAIGAIATSMMITTFDYTLTTTATEGGKLDVQVAAFKAPPTWMYLIGGMAAVGMVGAMMAPKKTCKSDQEGCHAYYQPQQTTTTYTA